MWRIGLLVAGLVAPLVAGSQLAGCVTPGSGGKDDDTAADTAETADPNVLSGPTGPAHVEVVCAPDDGYAVRFMVGLAEAGCGSSFGDDGHLRITMYELSGPQSAGTYAFEESTGNVWYAPAGETAEESGREGEVTISSWTDDTVTGTYHVDLDSGFEVAGSFTGPFCPSTPTCG